jgi:hypothetical protein
MAGMLPSVAVAFPRGLGRRRQLGGYYRHWLAAQRVVD